MKHEQMVATNKATSRAKIDKAMDKQLQIMQKQIEKLKAENQELTKSNQDLQKALNKKDLAFIKNLQFSCYSDLISYRVYIVYCVGSLIKSNKYYPQ